MDLNLLVIFSESSVYSMDSSIQLPLHIINKPMDKPRVR